MLQSIVQTREPGGEANSHYEDTFPFLQDYRQESERAQASLLTDSALYITNKLFVHLRCPDKIKSVWPIN